MKIKDSQIREHGDSEIHPFFTPYMIFNDLPQSVSFYLESKYEDEPYCLKNWQVSPKNMAKKFPQFYYWPEKTENKVIHVKKGETVRVPHGFYVASTRDGKPATYRCRMLQDI